MLLNIFYLFLWSIVVYTIIKVDFRKYMRKAELYNVLKIILSM